MLNNLFISFVFLICFNCWEDSLTSLSDNINSLLHNDFLCFLNLWFIFHDINNAKLFGLLIDFKYNGCFFLGMGLNLNFVFLNKVSDCFFNLYNLCYIILNDRTCLVDLFNCLNDLWSLFDNDWLEYDFLWLCNNDWLSKLLKINKSDWFWFFWFVSKGHFFNFVRFINSNDCELFLFNFDCLDLLGFDRWNNLDDFSNCRSDSWYNFFNMFNLVWCYDFSTFFSDSLFKNNCFPFGFLEESWCNNLFNDISLGVSYYSVACIFKADFSYSLFSKFLNDYFGWNCFFNFWMIVSNLFDYILKSDILFNNFFVNGTADHSLRNNLSHLNLLLNNFFHLFFGNMLFSNYFNLISFLISHWNNNFVLSFTLYNHCGLNCISCSLCCGRDYLTFLGNCWTLY